MGTKRLKLQLEFDFDSKNEPLTNGDIFDAILEYGKEGESERNVELVIEVIEPEEK